jgi:peroxin-12
MTDGLNPTNPNSIGALIAEEWTINPFSPLPSFLEMIMMEEASRATRQAFLAGSKFAQNALLARTTIGDDLPTSTAETNNHLDTHFSILTSTLHKWKNQIMLAAGSLLQNYGAEIRCIAIYLLERRSLHYFSATMAESMYGARRVKLEKADRSGSRKLSDLSSVDKTRLALLLSLGPYLSEKLDSLHSEYRDPRERHRLPSTPLAAIWNSYPYARRLFDYSNALVQWRFLLGQSVIFDPASFLLEQVVRRVTKEDTDSNSTKPSKEKDIPAIAFPPASFASPMLSKYLHSPSKSQIGYFLAASVAFSWLTQLRRDVDTYQHESRSQRRAYETVGSHSGTGFIPPPPMPTSSRAAVVAAEEECSLCRKVRTQPTASPSGFVYCYDCLLRYVRKHGVCPATNMQCTEANFVRIYEPWL